MKSIYPGTTESLRPRLFFAGCASVHAFDFREGEAGEFGNVVSLVTLRLHIPGEFNGLFGFSFGLSFGSGGTHVDALILDESPTAIGQVLHLGIRRKTPELLIRCHDSRIVIDHF